MKHTTLKLFVLGIGFCSMRFPAAFNQADSAALRLRSCEVFSARPEDFAKSGLYEVERWTAKRASLSAAKVQASNSRLHKIFLHFAKTGIALDLQARGNDDTVLKGREMMIRFYVDPPLKRLGYVKGKVIAHGANIVRIQYGATTNDSVELPKKIIVSAHDIVLNNPPVKVPNFDFFAEEGAGPSAPRLHSMGLPIKEDGMSSRALRGRLVYLDWRSHPALPIMEAYGRLVSVSEKAWTLDVGGRKVRISFADADRDSEVSASVFPE